MPSIFNKDNRETVLGKKRPSPQEIAAGLARYNPASKAPSWEEGLASGQYSSQVGLNYNPLKQGKSFGIIKNPQAFLDVVNNYTGLNLSAE
jgi:hypothetical protein